MDSQPLPQIHHGLALTFHVLIADLLNDSSDGGSRDEVSERKRGTGGISAGTLVSDR